MPYTTHYVDDGKGVHKIGSGVVTSSEMFFSAVQQASDEKRARKLRYALVDFSDVTEMKLTPEDIHRVIEINRKTASFTQGAVVAIVAPSQMSYALSRLWHALSEDFGWKSNVFHTRPDAIAWLKKQLLPCDGTQDGPSEFPFLNL